VWPANLVLFVYISANYVKLLNSLTTIDIHVISFLGDSKLTQQPALLEAPGLISGPDKDFYMFAFCFVVVVVFVVTLVLFAIPFTMLLIFH